MQPEHRAEQHSFQQHAAGYGSVPPPLALEDGAAPAAKAAAGGDVVFYDINGLPIDTVTKADLPKFAIDAGAGTGGADQGKHAGKDIRTMASHIGRGLTPLYTFWQTFPKSLWPETYLERAYFLGPLDSQILSSQTPKICKLLDSQTPKPRILKHSTPKVLQS
jgi:hypothetical protein